MMTMASLKIGSFNVGGINSPAKRKKILLYLKKLALDIVYLQETHLLPPEIQKLNTLGWKVVASAPFNSKARGVVILVRNTLDVTLFSTIVDSSGRYIVADASINQFNLVMCNIYAPNSYSKAFFLDIVNKLLPFGNKPLILGGDFNIVASARMDRSATVIRSPRTPKVGISHIAKQLNLIDVWRSSHPLERDYTCISAAHGSMSRIDYMLASASIFSRIMESNIEPVCLSDHAVCWIRIALSVDKGPYRQWRFPSHLTHSLKFREFLDNAWESYEQTNGATAESSPTLYWQTAKAVLRGDLISYCSRRDKIQKKDYLVAQVALTEAYQTYKASLTPQNRDNYLSKKLAFDTLISQMESKYTFASGSAFYRHGNRSGRLLSRLLKGQHPPTIIKQLRTANGSTTSKGSEISSILHSFYTSLYASIPTDIQASATFWEKINLPQMSDSQATSLISPITIDEVRSAIKRLKNNKAPGPDGLTNEFYKLLSPKLESTLTTIFNSFLKGDTPPLYFNSALLKILHKPGRDPVLPGSYRPISLLNSDYKLYTKIIAERLKVVLPDIIHQDQTGFIQGRHSVLNVRKVLAAIQWIESHRPDGNHAILSLDAEKAFDMVAWDHLFDSLARFGAPATFVSMIKNLYTNSYSQILSNSYLSQPFPIQRGTRQGCPLSPLLFAIALEPLAVALRNSTDFKGILVGNTELKVSLFADDMLLFLSNPVGSLSNIVSNIDQFSLFAGYKVNYAKSNIMPIASEHGFFASHPILSKFALCTTPLKYLGILIPSSLASLYKVNVKPVLQSIIKSLSNWKALPLSLLGRVAVIKSVLFPKLSYVLQMLPILPSRLDLQVLRSHFTLFLWNGKRPRTTFPRLSLPKELGGFALPDVNYFAQAAHFRHIVDWLLNSSTFSNFGLEQDLFAPYSLSALLHTPQRLIPKDIVVNPLFADTYRSWHLISKRLNLNPYSSPYNTFWGNLEFAPSLDNSRFIQWKEQGIMAIKDIFDPGGQMRSFAQLKEIYKLPNRDFFMFLQARHYAQSHPDHSPQANSQNIISQLLLICRTSIFKIRFLYSHLVKPSSEQVWKNTLAKWSADIPDITSTEILLKGCGLPLKSLPSASLQETHIKTINRTYISQSQRKYMVPEETGRCKKCGFTDATFFHNFWECGKIKKFWDKMIGFINSIFSLHLIKDPLPCLLLNFSPWDLGENQIILTPLLSIMLTVARQCILKHWIVRSPPFLHEVKSRLLALIFYERQKAFPDIERGVLRFYKKWEPYTQSLPRETQERISKVFEYTSWYLKRQIT